MSDQKKKGMSPAHWRQKDKHERNKKYEKQKERTTLHKIRRRLLNAARNDKKLFASWVQSQGGMAKVLNLAQNALNMQGFLDSLASLAGQKGGK